MGVAVEDGFRTMGTDRAREPARPEERPDPLRLAGERLVLGLRLTEGVPLEELEAHCGAGSPGVARYVAAGLLAIRDGRVALTDRGVLLSDTIFAELV